MHVGGDPRLAVESFKQSVRRSALISPIAVDISSVTGTPSHLNAHDAMRVIEALDEYDLHYAEQPVTTTI